MRLCIPHGRNRKTSHCCSMAQTTTMILFASILAALVAALGSLYPFLLMHVLTCLEEAGTAPSDSGYELVKQDDQEDLANTGTKPVHKASNDVSRTIGSLIRALWQTDGIFGFYRGFRVYSLYAICYGLLSSFLAKCFDKMPKMCSYASSSAVAGLFLIPMHAAATR